MAQRINLVVNNVLKGQARDMPKENGVTGISPRSSIPTSLISLALENKKDLFDRKMKRKRRKSAFRWIANLPLVFYLESNEWQVRSDLSFFFSDNSISDTKKKIDYFYQISQNFSLFRPSASFERIFLPICWTSRNVVPMCLFSYRCRSTLEFSGVLSSSRVK